MKIITRATVTALAVAGLLTAGCGDSSSSPTETATGGVQMASASVTVDGQPVDGGTFPQNHGDSTRFEARLRDGSGNPALGATVRVRATRPGGHGHMRQSEFTLYDDGTHGDRVPGDGLYCYEDFAEQYGCHGPNAEPGEHRWEFWGEDHHGNESNHWTITTTITGQ